MALSYSRSIYRYLHCDSCKAISIEKTKNLHNLHRVYIPPFLSFDGIHLSSDDNISLKVIVIKNLSRPTSDPITQGVEKVPHKIQSELYLVVRFLFVFSLLVL